MTNDKKVDVLADEYLDLWVSHLATLKLTPWDLIDDLSKELDPSIAELYRQWIAFYDTAKDSIEAGGEVSGVVDIHAGPLQSGAKEDLSGDRSKQKSCSSGSSHHVGSDEFAELKARLRSLTEQIAQIENDPGHTGDDEGGNN